MDDLPPSKIVTLNIRNGGGARVAAICEFIGSHEPEVVVLSEWRESAPGRVIKDWAESRGMVHQSNDGSTANGIFVAALKPFQTVSMTPPGSSAGILLLADFQTWTLLCAYFPQLNSKAKFFSICAEIAMANANKPFAIVGDLNTGNQLIDKSAAGTPYACAEHFDALTGEAGLIDLWRHANGIDAREWSWLSHQKNGFRIDHAFGNEPFLQLVQPSCVYDHYPREARITDHSALIITGISAKPLKPAP
jgi:exodeoxyribonuclease III